jgi:DNA-binding XRE family transcriptional regulator
MTTLLDIGTQLRAARGRQRLFKTKLATASGVHRNTVSALEAGTGNVELNTLLALCEQLGLDLCLVPRAAAATPKARTRRIALNTAGLGVPKSGPHVDKTPDCPSPI